jgi:predicted Zn-dependent peptidase
MYFERSTFGAMNVHVLRTKQFKTNTICLFIGIPLEEETVTPVSLIAHIMKRANAVHPQPQKFREALESMYGAGFSIDMQKRGNHQIVSISMDMVRDDLLADEQSLLDQALRFIFQCLFLPALQNHSFILVDDERATIRWKLQATRNDKIQFAALRCLQHLCADEPFRLSVNGIEDHLERWDGEQLYHAYLDWLKRAALDLYVVGDVEIGRITELLSLTEARVLLNEEHNERFHYLMPVLHEGVETVRHVTEYAPLNQAKLNIGYRISLDTTDSLFPALRVFNGLFGGFAHSKLFMNVREKNSLAYYVSSRILDSSLGLMMVQSGIEANKKEQAIAIITEQLDELRKGRITSDEWSQTKNLLLNSIRSLQDSAFERISADFAEQIYGVEKTIADWLTDTERVQPEHVVAVAEKVNAEVFYVLQDGIEVK